VRCASGRLARLHLLYSIFRHQPYHKSMDLANAPGSLRNKHIRTFGIIFAPLQ
jgi:hypothetical protein